MIRRRARIAAGSARIESSRWSTGSRSSSTPSSSATYSIDSSPAASVPATTTTSCPRRDCSCASWRTWSAAPPTFRRAITCTMLTSPPRLPRVWIAATPSVSQKSAASGEPPKSAAPAIAPPMTASQPSGTYACSPHGSPGRGRRPATTAWPIASSDEDEEDRGADETELEQHLVEGLLRDQRAVLRREVVRRLVGEALAGVGEVLRVVRRRQLALPAGAEPAGCRGRRGRRRRRRSAGGSSSPRTARASRAAGRTRTGGSRGRRCARRTSLPSRPRRSAR